MAIEVHGQSGRDGTTEIEITDSDGVHARFSVWPKEARGNGKFLLIVGTPDGQLVGLKPKEACRLAAAILGAAYGG